MKKELSRISCVMVAITLWGAVGCTRQSPQPSTEGDDGVESAEIATGSLTPKDRALKAKDELFKRLSSELMTAMANGGPSAAIEVCSQKAAKIAEEVGRDQGVSIGRTSFKLRNSTNKPPEWAEPLVAQRVEVPQFLELDNQRFGALLPIRLQAQCVVCHGPKEEIAQEVREQLAQRYPGDEATGFKDGDLRGWFWVEVEPAPQR